MAALTEIAIEAPIGVITIKRHTASLTDDEVLVRAIRAGVDVGILAVLRLPFRQGLAAIFTLNGFHKALFMIYD